MPAPTTRTRTPARAEELVRVTRSLTARRAKGSGEVSFDGPRRIPFVASSDVIDSHDEVIDQASWDLSRFLLNPVALWEHAPCVDPVGFWEKVRVEDGKLKAELVLYDAATSPEAERIWRRYCQGGPVACSVGFGSRRPKKEMRDGRKVRVFYDNVLDEISIVTLPANPEAVAEARKRASALYRAHRASLSITTRKASTMNLKQYLASKGIDEAELAKQLGMEPDTMLAGDLSEEQMAALCKALEVAPDDLLQMLVADEEEEPTAASKEGEGGGEEKSDGATDTTEVKSLLKSLGAKSVKEALQKVRAFQHIKAESVEISKRLRALEAKTETDTRAAILAKYRASGVLTKARLDGRVGAHVKTLKTSAELEAYLSTLDPVVDGTRPPAEEPEEGAGPERTLKSKSVDEAASASGIDPEKIRKAHAELQKRRRAELP